VELADDVGGEGVALRAGAQRAGQFQERGDRLVQGVAAGSVPLGAQGLDPGLGHGVLGPQGRAGLLAGLRPGVLGGAVQADAAVVAAGHVGGVVAADGHPAADAGEPVLLAGRVDPGVPLLAVLVGADAAVGPRLGDGLGCWVGHAAALPVSAACSCCAR
jgi:hypothetical protein